VARGSYSYAGGDHEKPVLNLEGAAQNWPTPSANEFQDLNSENLLARRERCKATAQNGNGFGLTVAQAASQWATPNAHDGRRPGSEMGSTQGANLKRDAEAFLEPGRQVLKATGAGSTPSSGPRRLNGKFVEWLMGWPRNSTCCCK
jgi:hypothetical protein